jgi:hypothetical protein
MSKNAEPGPAFETPNTITSPETESVKFESPITALAGKLNAVDESRFTDGLGLPNEHLIEQEKRLVAIRASWLKVADEHYQAEDFDDCLVLVKDIIADVLHSGDLTHLDEALAIQEDLYKKLGRKHGQFVLRKSLEA